MRKWLAVVAVVAALLGLGSGAGAQSGTPQEGWNVLVTYHYADIVASGVIVWKQAQHSEATLSQDYYGMRAKAKAYAKDGLWLNQGNGNPGPPESYLPPGAIHAVDLVYTYIN